MTSSPTLQIVLLKLAVVFLLLCGMIGAYSKARQLKDDLEDPLSVFVGCVLGVLGGAGVGILILTVVAGVALAIKVLML